MPVEHRAFLFNWTAFNEDLRVILEPALYSGDIDELIAFIRQHMVNLRDPYSRQRLEGDWETKLRFRDVQELGDVAMTEYYDPRADIGLGVESERLEELYDAFGINPAFAMVPVLGAILGPDDNPFDPGRLGSYFQTPEHVVGNHLFLTQRAEKMDILELDAAITMLNRAALANMGLYITF
jgi:hypothetical protein